jgi:CRISPR-associated protein Csx17
VNKLPLPGCTPEPLMNYLKALGTFRLIAEQADSEARGAWVGGTFVLQSKLKPEELRDFFLKQYRPTPIVGPWGGRSGFYPGSSERTAREALEAIAATTHERFTQFRDTIAAVRRILERFGFTEKFETDEDKLKLMRECRNQFPDEIIPWLDAVYVLTADDRKFPPLLGTGGNEGSGSYVSTFAQLVVSLLIEHDCDAGIEAALFGTPAAVHEGIAVGHFNPGAIGGPNSTVGFGGGGGVNPWDYLLAIEGTLLFAGAAARRIGSDSEAKAAFPFTVNPSRVGYNSSADAEDVRAELWLPAWDRPTTLRELRHFLAEGRAQLGRRQARSGVEFARAAVTHGLDRGISTLHRFAVAKRNGLSYFAAYLGPMAVRAIPQADLLNQLNAWIGTFGQVARADGTPPRFASAVRRIETAMMDFCRYGSGRDPGLLQAVLRAIGRAEAESASAPKVRAEHPQLQPIGGLSPEWLEECDDGSAEYRLAVSLAFMPGNESVGPFRTHLEPVVPRNLRRGWWAFDDTARGVVWTDVDLTTDLSAVLADRVLHGSSADGEEPDGEKVVRHALWAPPRFCPRLADVMAFLGERTDDTKIAELVWGLSAVRPSKAFRFRRLSVMPSFSVPGEYAALKLVLLTESAIRPGAETATPIHNEPRTIALLRAGRIAEAVAFACRRLQADGFPTMLTGPIAGVRKPLSGLRESPAFARRLLASLLFPLGRSAIDRLLSLTVRPVEEPQR